MASNSKHTKTDPAAPSVRVWVIEMRLRGQDWGIYDWLNGSLMEADIVLFCKNLSERFTDREHRYRAATLTFDDDGSGCTIY